MREIKFRAWYQSMMYYSNVEGPIGIYALLDSLSVRGTISMSEITLMQYTSLKDKNGKEIYEGDILKTERQEIAKVEWNNRIAGFSLYTLRAWNPKSCWDDTVEIIGNIYEDQDLLK